MFFQIEGLLDDEDFKMKVNRAELEHFCEDIYDRVTKPIEDALKASEITPVKTLDTAKPLERCEPRHDKTNKMTVHPARTEISLGIRPVWSVFAVHLMGS